MISERSCEPLLRLVFRKVDESMLREIAEADHGMDAQSHLAALRAIVRGDVPAPLKWEPQEVLELIRWSEPEDPNWKPGSTGARGHWMRLFSCAVLIRCGAEPANEGCSLGEDSTIIQLVDSAIKLGHDSSLAALQFLSWRWESRGLSEWDRPYFAIAILLLSALLGKCDNQTAAELIATASSDETTPANLLAGCQKKKTWQAVARRALTETRSLNRQVEEFINVLIGKRK